MPLPDTINIWFKIDEKKLHAMTDIPVEEINISDIDYNMNIPYREQEWTDDRNLSPKMFIENIDKEHHHRKVVENADIKYPIELYFHKWKWIIIDWVHRFTKILMLGHKTIKVRKISDEIVKLTKRSDKKYNKRKWEI